MTEKSAHSLKIAIILTFIILALLVYLPAPAFSQQAAPPRTQDLIVNGGFEGGFQEQFGIGYGWGGFSNGNAIVGWNYDDWSPVVAQGQYSQRIEIKEALEADRMVGVYQTVSVVPGEQYRLTIKGLIRSEEGSIDLSNYGYRLQYAIDYDGGTAWELLPADAWQELPWDEQPMSEVDPGYVYNTHEATVTAETERLTIYIRGWKKWINDGVGMFNLDEVSFVGPAPDGFQSPVTRAAAVSNVEVAVPAPADDSTTAEVQSEVQPMEDTMSDVEAMLGETVSDAKEATPATNAEVAETDVMAETGAPETMAESSQDPAVGTGPEAETMTESVEPNQAVEVSEPAVVESTQLDLTEQNSILTELESAPPLKSAPLPVSGFGPEEPVLYTVVAGIGLLLVLFVAAVTATVRRRA